MLTWIFLAGAVICLLYFFIIIIYAGITTASAVIWLLFAAFLFITDICLSRFLKNPAGFPMRLPVTLITLCAAGLVILLILEILIFYRIPATAEPGLDYVIVLGSSVKENAPGKVLTRRLDKAVEYINENPGTTIIVSGGKDGFDPVTEASVMRDYLLEKGVPESSVIVEDQSLNTVENIRYSNVKIAEAEDKKAEERPGHISPDIYKSGPRVGILTSNFHLYRALRIAARQGMDGAYGIAASCDPVLLAHLSVRDALAILKDRLAGNL